MEEQQPGMTIAPQADQAPPSGPIEKEPDQEQGQSDTEPASQWQFKSDEPAQDNPASATKQHRETESFSWTSAEFAGHQKSIGWYMALAFVTAVFAGLVLLLTHDKISTAVVIVAALILGWYAGRMPRDLQYRVDDSGITIGTKFYGYELFKSFAILDDGGLSNIALIPLKRFMPQLTVYCDPKDEDKVVNALADRLPFEKRRADVVDNLMRRIRF